MKILIAGHWSWYQYEESFSIGLKKLGHEVIQFKTANYFKGNFGKIQQKIPIIGPALIKINYDLINIIKNEKPNIFLSWACTHILPYTFKKINNLGILTVTYNNDDPFAYKLNNHSPWNHYFYWHWYLKNLCVSKKNFFYRSINIFEAKKYGANHAEILKPYFIQWKDYPIKLNKQEIAKLGCDLVFIGHYEPDNRVNYLKCLVQANLKVKLYGGKYWSKVVLGNIFDYFNPILPVYGPNYIKALSGAKICLVFLSKINRDTYTRRCFEIPASGLVMLAERTDDLTNMFREDEEACYFSNEIELIQKAKWLLDNPEIRIQIGRAALKRVWKDKHDVISRATEFINKCNS